jgi:mRNA interferase HigB
MVIIAWNRIASFSKQHPTAFESLIRWYQIVEKADWQTAHEMATDVGFVDSIGNDRFVFNIKGNDFRLVAMIHFNRRTVYIRFIGTHRQYDKINCSTI